ncbi:uncharacterized protein LOC112435166 [Tachysurus ichikawai]
MNHVYRKPFEHNSERDKDLRHQYVQRVFEMDSIERPHEYIFVDEAGFNLGEEEKERLERNWPLWKSLASVVAMELACDDIGVECCQGWIRHTRGFFSRCLGRENIACDVDDVLWPDPTRRRDAEAE